MYTNQRGFNHHKRAKHLPSCVLRACSDRKINGGRVKKEGLTSRNGGMSKLRLQFCTIIRETKGALTKCELRALAANGRPKSSWHRFKILNASVISKMTYAFTA